MKKLKVSQAIQFAFPLGLIAVLLAAAQPDETTTTVHFRLLDSTGQITPAMVCITDAEDGTVRLPPDGRANPPVSKIGDFTGGIDFQRRSDWIGPVRKMSGKGNNQDRSYVYESLPSLPYWNEPMFEAARNL